MGNHSKYILTGLLCTAAFCPAAQAQEEGRGEGQSEGRSIPSGIPDEFRDLVEPGALADDGNAAPPVTPPGALFAEFFVDGVRRGDVIIHVANDILRFDDSKRVVSKIPDAHNADDLILLLDRGFSAEDGKLCIIRPGASCSPPPIGSFGIVIDPQVPRIDLFRSHKYIIPPEPLKPSHPGDIGVIASLTGRVSGRTGQGRDSSRSSLSFDVVGGMGATSVFATGSWIDDGDLTVRYGGVQHFTGRYRAAAGFFLADVSDHFSQIDIIGAELHTTDLTRPPVDTSRDTPVLIFLDSDSYVDVLRGGELLYSQQLSAGPTRIPTRQFPGGSYNVEIRIRDTAGNTRSEDRFFSRPNDYARVNQWDYGIQAGITRDLRSNRFGLQEDGLLYISLRANRQIGRKMQIGGRIGVIDNLGFIEGFAERNLGALFLRGSGLVTSEGGYSLAAQLSGRIEKFSIAGRVRHSDVDSDISTFRGRSERYTELNLNISRPLPVLGGQINGFARYTDRANRGSSASWGATWNKSVRLFGGRTNGLFSAGYQRTERDHRFLLGFRLSWQGRRAAASAQIRHQIVKSRATKTTDAKTIQNAQFSYRSDSKSIDRWSLTARASHQDEGNGRFGVSGQLETGQFFVDGRADRNFGDNKALNYFGSLSTSIAIGRSGIAFSGKRNVDAGIMVKFDKAAAEDSIELRINRGKKRALSRGLTFVPLAPFLPQDVGFRPDKNSSIGYNNASTLVTAFPGNIVSIDPVLFKQVAIFGKLVDAEERSLANHIIQFDDQSYPTDDGGYFVFDLPLDIRSITVKSRGAIICELELPELADRSSEPVIDLDKLVCTSI